MTRRPYPADDPNRTQWLGDRDHARADATCPRCHDERAFYAFIAPDPGRRAQTRVERMVEQWRHSHPCVATYITTRKKAA